MIFKKNKFLNKGQTLLLGLVFSILMISLFTYGLYMGTAAYKKMRLQNAADAVAFSGAATQAKILNALTALNEGIVFINNLITKIVLVWLFLKACAALCFIGFCPCLGPLRVFERIAKPLLNKLKDLSWAMAWLQDQIIKFGRIFVAAQMYRIAKENGIKDIRFYPCNPFGGADSESSLAFLVKRADSSDDLKNSKLSRSATKLATGKSNELMSCYAKKWSPHEYSEALNYYTFRNKNMTFTYSAPARDDLTVEKPKGRTFVEKTQESSIVYDFKEAKAQACKKISSILRGGLKLPNPLVLRHDFKNRTRIFVMASCRPFQGLAPFHHKTLGDKLFWVVSQSAPFGVSLFDMNWSARMEKAKVPANSAGSAMCLNYALLKTGVTFYPEMVKH